jgi:flagellar biosynthesis protein FlhG
MTNRLESVAGNYPHPRPARFLAVTSGKGGVGKSVIAFNLADRLSASARVLLVDADFHAGNLHLLANVVPMAGWQGTDFAGGGSPAVTRIHDRLDLLASAGTDGRALPDMPYLNVFLKHLRMEAKAYDFVIFDTATGILPQTTLILVAVDEIILITTPELTALSNSYALYKVLAGNKTRPNVALLVNHEDRPDQLAYIRDKFNTITRQFLGHIPGFLGGLGHDRIMVEAVAGQTSLGRIAPENALSAAFAALAGRLAAGARVDQITWETINITALEADIRE